MPYQAIFISTGNNEVKIFGLLKWMQQEWNALSAILTNQNVTCCEDPISFALSLFFLLPFHPLFPCRQQWAVITKLLFSLWAPVTTLHPPAPRHSPPPPPASLSCTPYLFSSLCPISFALPPLLHPSLSTSSSLFIVKPSYDKLLWRNDGTGREMNGDRNRARRWRQWWREEIMGKRGGHF